MRGVEGLGLKVEGRGFSPDEPYGTMDLYSCPQAVHDVSPVALTTTCQFRDAALLCSKTDSLFSVQGLKA